MTLKLSRIEFRADGIFSELTDESGKILAHCLSHAYPDGNGSWVPKLYNGEFTCVRGMHRLEGMRQPFETFEITGVKNHTDILFHSGNWNADSAGCELVGDGIAQSPQGQMLVHSRLAFNELMETLEGLDSFTLTVE